MAQAADNSFFFRGSTGVKRLCAAKIQNHMISPDNWNDNNRTIDFLVCQQYENHRCVVCDRIGISRRYGEAQCRQDRCVTAFQTQTDNVEKNLIEIAEAGLLGKGVFATAPIPKYTLLGEYLGELLPLHYPVDASDAYQFTLENIAIIASNDFGNWTRFVNHHCDPNVSAANGMYGHRRSVIYRANRDIAAGEQLFVHYGQDYFSGMQMSCLCDAQPAPHRPANNGPAFPWPGPMIVTSNSPTAAEHDPMEVDDSSGSEGSEYVG